MGELRALLLVLTGPSGVGKTTLCMRFLQNYPVRRVVTSTTRPPRPNEVQGVDYWFETPESFKKKVEAHEVLEHARVYGYEYGVSAEALQGQADQDLIICLDVQGVQTFRKAYKSRTLAHRLVVVFVAPATEEALLQRLRHRGSDSEQTIQTRLETAKKELLLADSFDYCIQSGTPDEDFQNLQRIYQAEKKRN